MILHCFRYFHRGVVSEVHHGSECQKCAGSKQNKKSLFLYHHLYLNRSLLAGLELSLASLGVAVGLSCGLECGGGCVNTLGLLSTLEQFLHLGVRGLLTKNGAQRLVVEVDGQTDQEGVIDGRSLDLIDLAAVLANVRAHVVVVTYIQEELVKFTLGGALLKVDVADAIDYEDLAVLGDSALLCANRTAGKFSLDGSADSGVLCLFGKGGFGRLGLLCGTLALTLGSTLLLSVPVHSLRFLLGRGLRDGSGCGVNAGNASDLVTPGDTAGLTDVALDKVAVLHPVHVEGDVVDTTTEEDEETDHDRAETRAESLVVVAGSAPFGEAVTEEVIVALALSTTKDVGDYAETSKASRGFLAESIDLLLRRLLVLLDMDGGLVSLLGVLDWRGRVVGSDETLTGLVRVQDTGLLLVGSVDVVDVCKVLYTEERVEGSVATLVLGDFILETENFVVCQLSVWMQVEAKGIGLAHLRGTRRRQGQPSTRAKAEQNPGIGPWLRW